MRVRCFVGDDSPDGGKSLPFSSWSLFHSWLGPCQGTPSYGSSAVPVACLPSDLRILANTSHRHQWSGSTPAPAVLHCSFSWVSHSLSFSVPDASEEKHMEGLWCLKGGCFLQAQFYLWKDQQGELRTKEEILFELCLMAPFPRPCL